MSGQDLSVLCQMFIIIPNMEFIHRVFVESMVKLITFALSECLVMKWHNFSCLGAFIKNVGVM
jgi:hypothetical protein